MHTYITHICIHKYIKHTRARAANRESQRDTRITHAVTISVMITEEILYSLQHLLRVYVLPIDFTPGWDNDTTCSQCCPVCNEGIYYYFNISSASMCSPRHFTFGLWKALHTNMDKCLHASRIINSFLRNILCTATTSRTHHSYPAPWTQTLIA